MLRFVLQAVVLALFIGPILGYSAEPKSSSTLQTAIFAGGCFWCMEPPFDQLDGVVSTVSGYSNGKTKNPTYDAVSAGRTGHAEVVQVTYDPSKIGYEQLLDVFWHNIDPFLPNRQFCDSGTQYRSGIFYLNDQQRDLARASLAKLQKRPEFAGKKFYTQIEQAGTFYAAEDYHQDYYQKNPIRYKYYRYGCGRDKRLTEIWGQKAD